MSATCDRFTSCLTGSKSFFTNPKNHLSKKICTTAFVDKLFKFADPCFDLSWEIARSTGASKETLAGIDKGRVAVKAARDTMGLLNIFNGIIAHLYTYIKNVCVLARSLVRGDKEAILIARKKGEETKHTDKAVGRGEKISALIANTGKAVGCAGYITGFGICRPIAYYEKYISKNVAPRAQALGKAFPTVMMIQHIGAFIGIGADMVYQNLAYDRAIDHGGNRKACWKEYTKKMRENTLGILEKSFELVSDTAHHIGAALPAGFRIFLGLGIATFGIVKEWMKTE